MTNLQAIGALIVLAPFVALFIFIGVTERNWRVPAAIFGGTFAVAAIITAGVLLMLGVTL